MFKVGTKITLLPKNDTFIINGITDLGLETSQGWVGKFTDTYCSLFLTLESDMIVKCLAFNTLFDKITCCTERTSFPQQHLDEMKERYGFDIVDKIKEISEVIINQIVPDEFIPEFKFDENREYNLTDETESLRTIIESIPDIQPFVQQKLIDMYFILRSNRTIRY